MGQAYEKLGAFYLGRRYDPDTQDIAAEPLLYDSRDLTTHAVIVGMTGSGKTGLGVCLLEEAAIDRIPVIAIDPKGDLGNLLLNFPQLRPEDFRPWIDPAAATAQGVDADTFASQQADLWRRGLGEWDQDGQRIARLRDSVDMALYTPGSNVGRPLSILGSLRAPTRTLRDDPELLGQRVQAAATGLLTLLGVDTDPLTSREHILLSHLFERAWQQGQDVDLAGLVGAIPEPGIDRLGVLPLDSFFPPRERMKLALRLNSLLASPGFSGWLQGEPLDAAHLLYTATGKPRLSIINIAQLSDAERMSVVTLLLAELINWMRCQPGTGSLRAVLYIDEIFGYLPPTANPPSKALLLTLLKQARAFGLGLVLSTQNPVDLDYKALSNAGTWFLGRLQTDQDRQRVLDGLRSAGADTGQLAGWLATMGKRRFLMHNVHDSRPECFATRWALSYLSGPLAREQIRRLSPSETPATPAATSPAPTPQLGPRGDELASAPPPLPPGMSAYVLPLPRMPRPDERLVYQPCLLASADVSYSSAKYKIDTRQRLLLSLQVDDGPVALDWTQVEERSEALDDLSESGLPGASWAACPAVLLKPAKQSQWQRELSRFIRTARPLGLYACKTPKAVSLPGESEAEFRARLQQLASEERDQQAAALRQRYDKSTRTLRDRLLRAEQAVEREGQQSREKKLDAAMSFGSVLLSAFLGRKAVSASNARRLGSAAKSAGRVRREAADVARAEERAAALRDQLADKATQFEAEIDALEDQFDAQTVALDTASVRAKSADIQVHFVTLGWLPSLLSR